MKPTVKMCWKGKINKIFLSRSTRESLKSLKMQLFFVHDDITAAFNGADLRGGIFLRIGA